MFKTIRPFTIILSLTIIYAKDYYKGDTLVKKGVYAFYNYEFDKAVDLLTEARDRFPEIYHAPQLIGPPPYQIRNYRMHIPLFLQGYLPCNNLLHK